MSQKNKTCNTCKENDCHFVSRKKAKESRKVGLQILLKVLYLYREKGNKGFTIKIIGSSKRNMVYQKGDSNFDTDIHLVFTSEKAPINEMARKDIEELVKSIIKCEEYKDWTIGYHDYVFTLKNKLTKSYLDVGVIKSVGNSDEIIKNNNNNYQFVELQDFTEINNKLASMTKEQIDEVKTNYLKLRCKNRSQDKKELKKQSYSLLIEAVNNTLNES